MGSYAGEGKCTGTAVATLKKKGGGVHGFIIIRWDNASDCLELWQRIRVGAKSTSGCTTPQDPNKPPVVCPCFTWAAAADRKTAWSPADSTVSDENMFLFMFFFMGEGALIVWTPNFSQCANILQQNLWGWTFKVLLQICSLINVQVERFYWNSQERINGRTSTTFQTS